MERDAVSANNQPRVVVTRRWPSAVEAVLEERFDVVLNTDDVPMSSLGAGGSACRQRRALSHGNGYA